ncbi:MAG: hypothetical protein JNL58_23620 [Planctomyces sp.]|nr:hypothetical protein [Planctomyces sp.]
MSRRKRTGGPTFSLFAFQDIITCVMGIMLLLTLMMSLQITDAPGAQMASTVRSRADMLAEESRRLLTEISQMESQLSGQLSALNSGAILDTTLLAQSCDLAVRDAESAQAEAARVDKLVTSSLDELQEVRTRFSEIDNIKSETASLEQELNTLRQELEDVQSGKKRVYNAHESQAKTCWVVELSSPTDIRIGLMGHEDNQRKLAGIPELINWVGTIEGQGTALMLLVKPDAADDLEPLSKAIAERKIPFGFDLLPQDAVVLEPRSNAQP